MQVDKFYIQSQPVPYKSISDLNLENLINFIESVYLTGLINKTSSNTDSIILWKKLKIEDTYKMEDKYLKWSNIWKKLYFINTRCMHWI